MRVKLSEQNAQKVRIRGAGTVIGIIGIAKAWG